MRHAHHWDVAVNDQQSLRKEAGAALASLEEMDLLAASRRTSGRGAGESPPTIHTEAGERDHPAGTDSTTPFRNQSRQPGRRSLEIS